MNTYKNVKKFIVQPDPGQSFFEFERGEAAEALTRSLDLRRPLEVYFDDGSKVVYERREEGVTNETHQEIRDHFVEIQDALKRLGVDGSKQADICGVKRQTFYQYGFQPEARGARLIPADALDRLRVEFAKGELKRYYLPAFIAPTTREWEVVDAAGTVVETTTRRAYAYLAAALVHGEPRKGPAFDEAAAPPNSVAEDLSFAWLHAYHRGHVTPEDAMVCTGLGRYDVGRVGMVWFGWGIAPTFEQVGRLHKINDDLADAEVRHAA